MDLLIPFGDITERKMFGGLGIFEAGGMFALISGDHLYFKVDDSNRPQYEAMGSAKFGNMPYYAIPEDVLADDGRLLEWADASARLAKTARSLKKIDHA